MRTLITATLVVALSGVNAQAKTEHRKGDLGNEQDFTAAAAVNENGLPAGGTIQSVNKTGRGALTVSGKGNSVGNVAALINAPKGPGLEAGAAINAKGVGGTNQYYDRTKKQDLEATSANQACPGGYLTLDGGTNGRPFTVRSNNTGLSFQANASYDPAKLQRDNFTNTKYPGVTAQDVFKNTAGFLLLTAVGASPSMRGMGFKLADYYLSDATMKQRIGASGLDAQMQQVWARYTPDGQLCAVGGGGGGGGGGNDDKAPGKAQRGAKKKT